MTDSYQTIADGMRLPRWRPVVDVALIVAYGVREPAPGSRIFRARQRLSEWVAPPVRPGSDVRIMLTPRGKVVVR